MSNIIKHISVCICTFKRPNLLKTLLLELNSQNTDNLFSYSIIVVDNDSAKSAKKTVQDFQKISRLKVQYFIEPEQNIALARNKAVENAVGNFIAFIDDDEFPISDWLINLFTTYKRFKVDGVLGPVLPLYEGKPPKWVVKGKFYERPTYKTGTVLHWTNTRTGNVLIKKHVFNNNNMFKYEFGIGGEDKDFFRRMISQGFKFVWCAEAPVYETVPKERCKRSFMLRRALLRGSKMPYANNKMANIKSLFAIPIYAMFLPFLLFKHHLFMKYLIKECDHIGRVLTMCGLNVIEKKYILE